MVKSENRLSSDSVEDTPTSMVAPIESVKEIEVEDQSDAEMCWNCANNKKQSPLDGSGNCGVCGFEKDKLYNGFIEADKARARLSGQI